MLDPKFHRFPSGIHGGGGGVYPELASFIFRQILPQRVAIIFFTRILSVLMLQARRFNGLYQVGRQRMKPHRLLWIGLLPRQF